MRIHKKLTLILLFSVFLIAFSAAAESYPNLCNYPVWLEAQGLANGCVTNQQWHDGVHAYEAARKDGTLAHFTSVAAPVQSSAPAAQPATTQSGTGSGDPNMCHSWGLGFCTSDDHWIAGWYAHPDNGAVAEDIPPGNIAYIIAYTGSVLPRRKSAAPQQDPNLTREYCNVTVHKAASNRIFITSKTCLINDVTHGRGEQWKRFELGVRLTEDLVWPVLISVERTNSPVDFKYRTSYNPTDPCIVGGEEGKFQFHHQILKTLQGHRKKIKVTASCVKA